MAWWGVLCAEEWCVRDGIHIRWSVPFWPRCPCTCWPKGSWLGLKMLTQPDTGGQETTASSAEHFASAVRCWPGWRCLKDIHVDIKCRGSVPGSPTWWVNDREREHDAMLSPSWPPPPTSWAVCPMGQPCDKAERIMTRKEIFLEKRDFLRKEKRFS